MNTNPKKEHSWRVLSSESYSIGPYTIKMDRVVSPDGCRKIDWVYHAGKHAVATLAVNDDGSALLVREYRHPLGGFVLNIPAGGASHANSEEELLQHAARELAEEAGVEAAFWQKIGAYHPLPGFSSLTMHLYFAAVLRPVQQKGDGDEWKEVEEVVLVPLEELYRDVVLGKYPDSPTMMAVLWAAAAGMISVQPRSRDADAKSPAEVKK
ncbi:MAG: NUDIX hydrolase [Armatimonadota bacterium]